MPTGTILVLGAFAGLTIYLGLPLAFLKQVSSSLKVFLSMLATGVLVFLLYDVLRKASEPIEEALNQVRSQHAGSGLLALDVSLLAFGLGVGSLGLVYFNTFLVGRLQMRKRAQGLPSLDEPPAAQAVAVGRGVQEMAEASAGFETVPTVPRSGKGLAAPLRGELSPQMLAFIIATGIGLHNFSEGLSIGQSAAVGALQLALILIIGFGLHNMTEGFGIAGPLTGQAVSWKFLVLLGLIGGGPTFVGTVVGMLFHSPHVFILFLALAAGAILYVLAELFGVAKRFKAPQLVMWGLLIGFLLGYATDLIVTFAGA